MFFALKCGILFTVLLNVARADDDKYEMFYDKLELIKGKQILDATKLSVEKSGPTNFVIGGDLEHFEELSDKWLIALEIFKSNTADGEYRSLAKYPSKGEKQICQFMKNEYKKLFYDSIKDCSTAPHFDTCPLKEAKYSFNKCAFDASVFKKFMNKGYYIIKVFLSTLIEANVVEYNLHAHAENDK